MRKILSDKKKLTSTNLPDPHFLNTSLNCRSINRKSKIFYHNSLWTVSNCITGDFLEQKEILLQSFLKGKEDFLFLQEVIGIVRHYAALNGEYRNIKKFFSLICLFCFLRTCLVNLNLLWFTIFYWDSSHWSECQNKH